MQLNSAKPPIDKAFSLSKQTKQRYKFYPLKQGKNKS